MGVTSARCGRKQRDLVAEEPELIDQPPGLPGLSLRIETFSEVVTAEVVVGDVAGQHGRYRGQDAVPDGDQGPLAASP